MQAAGAPVDGELNKFNLYLPLHFIQKKMEEWNLASPLTLPFIKMIKENKELRKLRYLGEYIMAQTEQIMLQNKTRGTTLNVEGELDKIREGIQNEEWKPVNDENAQAELFSKKTNKLIYKILLTDNFFNNKDQQKENFRMAHSLSRSDYRKQVSLLFAESPRKFGSDVTKAIANTSP